METIGDPIASIDNTLDYHRITYRNPLITFYNDTDTWKPLVIHIFCPLITRSSPSLEHSLYCILDVYSATKSLLPDKNVHEILPTLFRSQTSLNILHTLRGPEWVNSQIQEL